MQATLSPVTDAAMTPRARQLLAHPPYADAKIPDQFQRHIVEYTRREQPGSILVDTDARYLYYVLPGGKAIRYGVAVGEEAMAFSGVATVGRMAEWPDWVPTADIQQRLGPYPKRVAGGPANPLGARGIYSTRATRTRCIASTAPTSPNISAGDLVGLHPDEQRGRIDLYQHVKPGATVWCCRRDRALVRSETNGRSLSRSAAFFIVVDRQRNGIGGRTTGRVVVGIDNTDCCCEQRSRCRS